MTQPENLPFFRQHGLYTDPHGRRGLISGLGQDPAQLCSLVQGLLIHDHFGAEIYEAPPKNIATASRDTLPVSDRLAQLVARNDGAGLPALPTDKRLVGTCRDFALMLCAFFRENGVPARLRCGFANYLGGDQYEDHWLVEYWMESEGRWAKADAQLDNVHRAHLNVDFDIADVPEYRFIVGRRAWELARTDAMNPDWFGHGQDRGLWFIRVNLARDLMALCKHEVSPWDDWRKMSESERMLDETTLAEAAWMDDKIRTIETGVLEARAGLSP
ncbi:transglutaminase-like domain-containing protein [Hwanghaeella grinnelliae]|uniref:transglutaminase-like domain-containing protein n=1 Tax=Hwanghaeella grinnelliae TaxID=2500179 RepID=UPI0013867CDF|nr:transglutaminase-like domain-containing protein [Hwanghaeella grinnelliae]